MTLDTDQQRAILQANETIAAENDYLKQKLWALTETARMVAAQAHSEILVREALIASILQHLGADSLNVEFKLNRKEKQLVYQVTGGVAEIRLETQGTSPPQKPQVQAG